MMRHALAAIFALLLASLPEAAHAACTATTDPLANAFCEGEAADAAAADLAHAFKAAVQGLSPPAQAGLFHQQSQWKLQFNQTCTFRRRGGILVDFRCAREKIQRRTAELQAVPYDSRAEPQSLGIHFFIVSYWNCSGAKTNYAAASCEGANASADFYEHRQLLARFELTAPTDRQAALDARDAQWRRRVALACGIPRGGRLFIDFGCVDRAIAARDAVLSAAMRAPALNLRDNGVFAVRATAMPWFWHAGLNGDYPFGPPDGTGPTIISLARLGALPGRRIAIEYQSGVIAGRGGKLDTDANGFWKPGSGGIGYGGSPTGQRQSAAICGFADATGRLVTPPFLLGDGPTVKQVPAGATQLQIGVNQEIGFDENTGGLNVSVTLVRGAD